MPRQPDPSLPRAGWHCCRANAPGALHCRSAQRFDVSFLSDWSQTREVKSPFPAGHGLSVTSFIIDFRTGKSCLQISLASRTELIVRALRPANDWVHARYQFLVGATLVAILGFLRSFVAPQSGVKKTTWDTARLRNVLGHFKGQPRLLRSTCCLGKGEVSFVIALHGTGSCSTPQSAEKNPAPPLQPPSSALRRVGRVQQPDPAAHVD